MTDCTDEELEEKILSFLSQHSGSTIYDIVEQTDIRFSQVRDLLQHLENKKQICSKKKNTEHVYFLEKKYRLPIRTGRHAEELRQKIYDIIEENPGLHLSKIADMLGMSIQLAEYHLTYMGKKNLIISVSKESGYYKRFFIKNSDVGVKEKQIVTLLRTPSLLKIVLLLWKKPHVRHKELLKYIDIAPSTLTHHLNHLSEKGIISATSYGREKGYCLLNEREIIGIVKKNELNKVIDGFKDLWDDIHLF